MTGTDTDTDTDTDAAAPTSPRGRFRHVGIALLVLLLSLSPRVGAAQERADALPYTQVQPMPTDTARPWLTSRERWTAAGFVAAALVSLPFDGALARGFERPSAHRDRAVARGASVVRWLGDPGAVALSAGSYALGRVSRSPGLADAGLHATEAVLVSGATTNVLKLAIGRARPRAVSGGNAFTFRPGRGISDFASLPSGHTTAAFAAASAISAEIACSSWGDRHGRLAHVAPAMLYGVAALVGVSRMYHDAHWASDVVTGAGIGSIGAHALVRRAHSGTSRSWLDHNLLGGSGAATPCHQLAH